MFHFIQYYVQPDDGKLLIFRRLLVCILYSYSYVSVLKFKYFAMLQLEDLVRICQEAAEEIIKSQDKQKCIKGSPYGYELQ